MKRGQAAIEYIVLIGILLFFLIPIVHYALNESTLQLRIHQLDNSLRRIAKAANTVYALGPGAQEIVTVTFPSGIEQTLIQNNSISAQVTIFGGISDVHFATIPDVSGSIPTQPGTYYIRVTTLENSSVDVRLR